MTRLGPGRGPVEAAVSRDGEDARILVRGDVDRATAPVLRDAFAEALRGSPRLLTVDLAGVDFLDSTGVQVLVEALEEADRGGTRLAISGASGVVERLLDLAGVRHRFDCR